MFAAFLAILGLAVGISGQAQSTEDIVAAHVLPMTWDGTAASGKGNGFLIREVKANDVVLLGEQHGTADIPKFMQHLIKAIAEPGGKAKMLGYVLEVGPFSAEYAERRIRADGGLDKFFSEGNNRFGIPFLFFKEEARLASSIMEASEKKSPVLFGVDQEFVGAGGILVGMLESEARTEAQQQTVRKLKENVAKDPFWLGNAKAEAIEALHNAFTVQTSPRAADILEAIAESNAIYAPFMGRGGSIYEANYKREMLMRAYFQRTFGVHNMSGLDKLVGKFGATHALRGRSFTDVPGFGGFLDEWVGLDGRTFFNVLVDCGGGEVRNPQTGKAEPCEPVVDSKDSPLRPESMRGKAYVIDLRPLRRHLAKWTGLDHKTALAIYGFDAYVVLPDVRPATLF